jgi:hypothetical protein
MARPEPARLHIGIPLSEAMLTKYARCEFFLSMTLNGHEPSGFGFAVADNLGNFLRTLATPDPIKDRLQASLRDRHGRYVAFRWPTLRSPRIGSLPSRGSMHFFNWRRRSSRDFLYSSRQNTKVVLVLALSSQGTYIP